MKREMKPIVVIGAGIVGVSTALWLKSKAKKLFWLIKHFRDTVRVWVMRDYWLNGQWYLLTLLNFGNQPQNIC